MRTTILTLLILLLKPSFLFAQKNKEFEYFYEIETNQVNSNIKSFLIRIPNDLPKNSFINLKKMVLEFKYHNWILSSKEQTFTKERSGISIPTKTICITPVNNEMGFKLITRFKKIQYNSTKPAFDIDFYSKNCEQLLCVLYDSSKCQ